MVVFENSDKGVARCFRVAFVSFALLGLLLSACTASSKLNASQDEELGMDLFDVCRNELGALPATSIIKRKLPNGSAMTQADLRNPDHLNAVEKGALLKYVGKRKGCWDAHLNRKKLGWRGKAGIQLYAPFEALRDQNTAALIEDKITVGQYNQNRQRITAAYKRDLMTLQARLSKEKDDRTVDAVLLPILEGGALQRCQQEMNVDQVIDGY